MADSDTGGLDRNDFTSNNTDLNNSKSILKSVKKRVSGLFPISITKWFSPKEGSVRRRDSTDDDDDDQPEVQQPPRKRPRLPESDFIIGDRYAITSTPIEPRTANLRHLHQPGPSGLSRNRAQPPSPPAATAAPAVAQNVTHFAINGDNRSDSEDSTSGYSSNRTIQQKDELYHSDQGKSEMAQNRPTTNALNTNKSPLRSLFSPEHLRKSRSCMSSRRPSFNASTFGSPSFVDRTVSTRRAINSPFYEGPTRYGGACAPTSGGESSNRYATGRSPRICPRDRPAAMRPVNETQNDVVNLSKTARRILDTLEQFSTDVKKIPPIDRPLVVNEKFKSRKTPYTRNSAATHELLVPNIPDLLKMKERLQNSTEQVRKVATSSKSVLNQEYSIPTKDLDKTQKHTNKMKTKLTSSRAKKEDTDVIDAPNLPDVQLPITNLPKFDFTLPPPPPPTVKPLPMPVQTPPPAALPTTTTPTKTPYTFSKPTPIPNGPKSIKSINNFKYSEPQDPKSSDRPTTTTTTFTFKAASENTAPRKKLQNKNNGQMDMFIPAPKQLVSGSVMDVLGQKGGNLDQFKPKADTWECKSCMLRNKNELTKCVACETPRAQPKVAQQPPPQQQPLVDLNKFKMTADKWECTSCMVRNNQDAVKCVACTTPKPGSSAPVAADNKLPSTSNTTWECSKCKLRNNLNQTECACKNSNTPVLPASSGFADFIQKQQETATWECASCMVRNASEKLNCACCEAPKPGTTVKPGFGFLAQTPSTQFKFGIDKGLAEKPTGIKFGIDTTTEKQQQQQPQQFKFGIDKVEKPTETEFKFGAVETPPKVETKRTSFGTGTDSSSKMVENKKELNPPPPTTGGSSFAFSKPDLAKTDSLNTVTSTENSGASTTLADTPKPFGFGMKKSVSFNFGAVSSTTAQTTTKPTFSFGATTPVATSTTVPVSVSSSTPSSTTTNIFGIPTETVPATIRPATTTESTFVFGSKKLSEAPQFDFGAGIPFSSNKTAGSSSFGGSSNVFGGPSQFNVKQTNNNNKSEPKTGSFLHQEEQPAVTAAAAPVSFNFGAAATTPANPPTTTGMFNFSPAVKTETKSTFGGGNVFGSPNQTVPQNGSFSFGAPSAAPGFSFGASTSSTPAVFGFGANQAGTGSVAANSTAAAASSSSNQGGASGIFAFGTQPPPTQQQPQIPAFSPDVKPMFNFSSGAAPSFTAQVPGGASQSVLPQRRIRKAVRRTQPR